jgi:Uma2 family endonuclease
MIQRASKATGLVDYETYRILVEDGEKADLIDGVIYMASPETPLSNSLVLFIANLIDGFTAARDIDGFTFNSRVSCKITDYRAPEPDVAYVRPEHAHRVEEQHVLGAPDIAVEVVSRDSRRRDYVVKRELYQQAGVSEYWVIDPMKCRATFFKLEDGEYEEIVLENNRIFRTSVIPGFWLDVNWLLIKPVPRAYRCLEQILAAPKKKPKLSR